MVSPDFSWGKKYWPKLSKHVIDNYGEDEIKEPALVQKIFKECFQILGESFLKLIHNEKRASFYLYAHNFHENSIELYYHQIAGNQLAIDEGEFAGTRRVLKIILEQSCGLELIGSTNYGQEMLSNKIQYLRLLEELLYIGYKAIEMTEIIARSQLFPNAIGLIIKEGVLNLLTYQPYPHLFKFIHKDLSKHNDNIVIHNTMIELKKFFFEHLGIDYDVAGSIIHEQVSNPQYKFGFLSLDQIIDLIIEDHGYSKDNLSDFYRGLSVSKDNFLSFENCILRNQDINRHTFRPILQVNIDGQKLCLIGRNKWTESLSLMVMNALPYNICPEEWLKHKPIRQFINNIRTNHDKVLENPIKEKLETSSIKFHNSLDSLFQRKGNNIRIDIEKIGEIDIVYLDEPNKIIYVVECKHNRSRFDMFNWRRDYSKFKEKYETQLDNKVNWASANKNLIEGHFAVKYEVDGLDLSDYIIRGIFAINAPTVYMHNGKYRALTIHDMNNLIDGNYVDLSFLFKNEDDGSEVLIKHPYF
ncbi:MAG: hypothetical protein ACI9RM_002471, partial [Ulvibacter sp.]